MPPRKLSVAFVGCGNIANYHCKAALATERVVITALVDPNPAARATIAAKLPPGVAEFDSLADALAADPERALFEAVDIMVPSFMIGGKDLHEMVAMEALGGRRHVLLEKPVTTEPEAAERVDRFHREHAPECVLAVAENAQFWPEILAAKRCVESGEIGELLSVRAKAWESAAGEWAVDYAPGSWRCDDAKLPAASFTYDSASHWLRPLRMWLGEVTRVVGVTGKAVTHMAGVSMSQHVLMFSSGKSAIFETMLAPAAISDQPFFTLQGTRGEVRPARVELAIS